MCESTVIPIREYIALFTKVTDTILLDGVQIFTKRLDIEPAVLEKLIAIVIQESDILESFMCMTRSLSKT